MTAESIDNPSRAEARMRQEAGRGAEAPLYLELYSLLVATPARSSRWTSTKLVGYLPV